MTGPGGPSVEESAARLAAIDLFATVAPETLEEVARAVQPHEVPGGAVLMREGEAADAMYVVLSGRLQIRVADGDRSDRLVDHIGRGEVVGEMALITRGSRTATVTADRDSHLLRLSTEDFDRLVSKEPSLLRAIAGQVVIRMQDRLHAVPSPAPVATIALVPLDADAVASGAIDRLAGALCGQVPGSRRIEQLDPATSIESLEPAHPLLVMVTDGDPDNNGPTEWTQRCLRESDVIVLVASANDTPGPRAVEAVVNERQRAVGTRVELVLVRAEGQPEPRGTRRWLQPRQLDGHHHFRIDHDEDAARIARTLRNEAIVLVLSGGGARGMAEIGVIRAIQELGIPIDAVAGTSAGALVGASAARGWAWTRIADTLREGVVTGRRVLDLTLPALSIASGRRVTERLQAAADNMDIEDLLIPFFCISTNLTRKQTQVHASGPAWRAVRASLAIPGVFPPVSDGDDVLVDGGVLDNYPVRNMRLRHSGATVIGVDVSTRRDLMAKGLPDTGIVSGWRAVRLRIPGSAHHGGLTMMRVLARLTELGVREGQGGDVADITVKPSVQEFPMLDFDRFDEIVERGYRTGLEVLRPWWEGRAVSET